jgi:hypothetical protein
MSSAPVTRLPGDPNLSVAVNFNVALATTHWLEIQLRLLY